ncbi:MAG: 16S rRNA (guanine(527)-N(7))-methyltransferase RsmG [Hymenobacteraceae bacterium]|nr:16S rRNA (guanine(527)-N(7))-methyltransferase RsmG [Hymenobacteraceae bacterium]MDX5395721.1 16S rRNA (guanine(527)-N(7))-methyltransferase RsmG [Hymenobacteraceae bacterium]MDX5442694.1 16S rRNA (guanine(527)-N(7))-methyltransferase RsmG [Hymenobacteraceae bacterium]MDX5511773.1 16S rRNA (guanine(527)-N(7))-methyltransferase RsmG [Hymenobacteraceae bacterium]
MAATNSIDLILKYFPDLNQTQQMKFEKLVALYQDWNSKINVVSRKDMDQLVERHLLHSLGIAKVVQFPEHTSVMDVGTGGGLPGIPLAILFPEVKFHLVDSIGKKIKVVQAIADELHLHNVSATHTRAEQVHERYDFIISRAVTRLAEFYQWIQFSFKKESVPEQGLYYLKGGDLTEELAEAGLPTTLYNLSDYFTEEFFETKKVVYVPVQPKSGK